MHGALCPMPFFGFSTYVIYFEIKIAYFKPSHGIPTVEHNIPLSVVSCILYILYYGLVMESSLQAGFYNEFPLFLLIYETFVKSLLLHFPKITLHNALAAWS